MPVYLLTFFISFICLLSLLHNYQFPMPYITKIISLSLTLSITDMHFHRHPHRHPHTHTFYPLLFWQSNMSPSQLIWSIFFLDFKLLFSRFYIFSFVSQMHVVGLSDFTIKREMEKKPSHSLFSLSLFFHFNISGEESIKVHIRENNYLIRINNLSLTTLLLPHSSLRCRRRGTKKERQTDNRVIDR